MLQQRSLDVVPGIEFIQDVQEQLKELRYAYDCCDLETSTLSSAEGPASVKALFLLTLAVMTMLLLYA